MKSRFVHLRVHSEYSIVNGIIRIKPMMKALPELGMNSVAVTDFCNLFAAVKIFKTAVQTGIKPIIGCDLPICEKNAPEKPFSLLLLCQNEQGYKNLTRLVSRAYLEGQYQGLPRVNRAWIRDCSEGLIAVSGGMHGDIGKAILANKHDSAQKYVDEWKACFPNNFYLEIQRTDREHEAEYNNHIIRIAEQNNIGLVATNDACFLKAEDFDAHEARVCIHDSLTLDDPRKTQLYSPQQYLKSAEEMEALFKDIPQAIQNTVEIAKRCNFILEIGKNYLPNFPTPQHQSEEVFLSEIAKQGLDKRLTKQFHDATEALSKARPSYEARLKTELEVICKMGFPGYFLIVADFIQWAKTNDIPVGPGRGSGAGSIVAYALGITDLDPISYDLLFERFLNPERVSMPDFDIDFCMEGRDRVIDYVAEKYGRNSVSQIITFGTMAAKAVVRDVGRVLGHPYGFVDKIAKLIPFEVGMTLTKALEEEELQKRYRQEDEVKDLIDLALKLEGITRNAGKHAGGVVIAPSDLTDFTAIYCEQGSNQLVTQFDKDDVEAVGLVKFDFLGLRTLTIINWALKTINQKRSAEQLPKIDINDISLTDKKTFDLLKACQTTAVFQLESRGMKELINRLQPDCFEEIIALVALFRPGPLQSGMVDDFINRKHGRASVDYPHPDLEPILKPTYGVILYQEQVMQIAQVLANYTLGAADMLRRAMGKKKPEEMAKQREIFTQGALERGVDEKTATYIFDLMEKFAGYGFNKSHSAAYALVSYQTAWLKTHHPSAFMAAVLSSDMDNTDKVVNFLSECKAMELEVKPPCINHSLYPFSVTDSEAITYGLGAIKGVGEAAIEGVLKEREAQGEYTGLFNFCERQDLRKVNRRVIEALIKSGSFDCFGIERSILFASIDKALSAGAKHLETKQTGQADLLGLIEENVSSEAYVKGEAWDETQRLKGEKETLGHYITGHPAKLLMSELAKRVTPIADLNPSVKKKAYVCGITKSIRKILTKKGKRLYILSLEDTSAQFDVVVFSEVYEALEEPLQSSDLIIIEGEISHDDYSGGVKMSANKLFTREEARTLFAQCLTIRLKPEHESLLPLIEDLLQAHKGHCLTQLTYQNSVAQGCLNLPASWRISPKDELLSCLEQLLGKGCAEMLYPEES